MEDKCSRGGNADEQPKRVSEAIFYHIERVDFRNVLEYDDMEDSGFFGKITGI